MGCSKWRVGPQAGRRCRTVDCARPLFPVSWALAVMSPKYKLVVGDANHSVQAYGVGDTVLYCSDVGHTHHLSPPAFLTLGDSSSSEFWILASGHPCRMKDKLRAETTK